METGGVSLCVLRNKNGTKSEGHARKRKRGQPAAEQRKAKYRDIAELSAEQLRAKGPCVLVDPNRRDILYTMHEHSTAENRRVYRYTSMSRRRNSGQKAARRS